MRGEMQRLTAKHQSILDARNIGLFGTIELRKNSKNERMVPMGGTHPVMGKINAFFREKGLFTVLQWGTVMCNPPLCINEAQLKEGFAIVDEALALADEAFEG
jgi:taurine---2-oxoglutarate transaminase